MARTTSDLTARDRTLVLAICCLSLLIVGMDVTIVNVALPSIRSDLGASVSGLQWVVDAYSVVLASLLVLSGSTADRFGRRRTFQAGLTLFTLGSLLCSLAPGLGWLIAFRMVQAVGGSMLNPVAMSIISNTFTDARERARAIGIFAGVVGVSLGVGPVLGGVLVESIGWRSIFWINVPIGVVAVVLAALFVPESKAPRARRLDPLGQVLVIGLLVCLVSTIIEAPKAGAGEIWALGLASAVLAAAFLAVERRSLEPLIELDFFRSVPFSGATLTALCAFGGFSGFLFLNTLYLQEVRGLSALHAGLFLLPMAVMTVVFAPLSGRIVAARGPRLPLVVAGCAMLLSVLPLTQLSATTSYGALIVTYAVFGLGFGFVNAPITNAAVSGMPRSQSGVAAAIASTSRQVGASLGVAVAGALVSGAARAGFSGASHAAWWVVAGCAAAVLLLALATTGRRAQVSARRTAERLVEDEAEAVSAMVSG